MRVVVIGGGWFGSSHARQLLKGRPDARVVVVDRDPGCRAFAELAGRVECVAAEWDYFLRGWVATADPDDRLIPAPLAPHLVWDWLRAELSAGNVPAPRGWGLPYEVAGGAGEVFLSAAAWICPSTCVEPAHCPVLHAPRDWDLADLIEARAVQLGFVPCVLRCTHFVNGVGAIRAGALQEAAAVGRASCGESILVATSSRCHAAVGALAISGAVARQRVAPVRLVAGQLGA